MMPGITPPVVSPFLPSSSLTDSPYDDSDSSSYTINGVLFGEPYWNRRIIVAVHWAHPTGSGNVGPSSVSIGGVSATAHVQNPAGFRGVSIFSASVPNGTSGTVAINFSTSMSRCGLGVYRVINLRDSSPVGTASGDGVAGALVTLTASSTADAVAIAGATVHSDAESAATWGDLTEEYDKSAGESVGSYRVSGARTAKTPAGATYSGSVSWTNGAAGRSCPAAMIVWR